MNVGPLVDEAPQDEGENAVRPVAKGLGVAVAAVGLMHAAPSVTAVAMVRRLTPRLAGRGRADHVALTFDDGPDAASTPYFLDLLDELGVRATFFVLGQQVAAHPRLARRLAADGHEVALHGWHHRNSLSVAPRALRSSLVRGMEEVATVTGVRPVRYRPPYGIATTATFWAAKDLGLTPVLWDAWGRDWIAGATAASVLHTVRRNVRGGSTVLLHDSDCTSSPRSWQATLGALRPLVEGLHADGLAVGPLREHGMSVA